MKLLVDMNLSPRWAELLISSGMEAIHWSKVGAGNAPDTVIMDYAKRQNYVVLTHDLDFGSILAATQGLSPSVVQIRAEDVSPDVIGLQVIYALQRMELELKQGALLTIDPKRTRVRVCRFASGTSLKIPEALEPYSSGFRSPSRVGISSETVGWICTAR